MIEGLPSGVDVPSEMLLAGYFLAVPEPIKGSGVPRTERLTTASDCLIDRLPEDGCRFGTAPEALTACLSLQVPVGARLYALMVPSDHVSGFVADILTAGTEEPVLLAHLDSRTGRPGREVAEDARELGWEVLGYATACSTAGSVTTCTRKACWSSAWGPTNAACWSSAWGPTNAACCLAGRLPYGPPPGPTHVVTPSRSPGSPAL
ncbi:hypothetical protein ACWGB8_12875 [Kitasatospora sp. NPDC054939]